MFGFEQGLILELLARFVLDVVAVSVLSFAIYYRRYRDKVLVTTASLFNIFVFAVLLVLSSVEFGLSAGFGLFAILALFTLRSEPISKTEISYFFGSVSIAVICAVLGTSLVFVLLILCLLLLGAYVFDHPNILKKVDSMKVTLDKIPEHVISQPSSMTAELESRFGIEVLSYRIIVVDYITEMVRVDVHYRAI